MRKPDRARNQPMSVLVEDAADPLRRREREHVPAVRGRPVRHRQTGTGARDEAAGEEQEDCAGDDELGETVKHAYQTRRREGLEGLEGQGWTGRRTRLRPIPPFPPCPSCLPPVLPSSWRTAGALIAKVMSFVSSGRRSRSGSPCRPFRATPRSCTSLAAAP